MPVQHIVWMTVKDPKAKKAMTEVLAGIESLRSIPGVLDINTGENFTDRAQGCTHGAIITLESREALDAYISHPDHQRVGALIRANCELMALDYEYS
jgi:hypothetical protein